jgi:hypothetical protein
MESRIDAGPDGRLVDAVDALFDSHTTLSLACVDDGEPWVGRVFFVHDMQSHGRLDLACALILSERRAGSIERDPRVAFAVGGDLPDHWLQGTGRIVPAEDDMDAKAIIDRLCDKSKAATDFLRDMGWTALRIRVERLRYTNVDQDPPVAELSFA